MKSKSVLLADDHPLALEGLRVFLAPYFQDVNTVTDGRALVDEALRLKPDLIILDITMPGLNGIDAAVRIRKRLPNVKLLFVTMHVNPAYLEAALKAGATGYVIKSAARQELIEAVRRVLAGEIFITGILTRDSLEMVENPAELAAAIRLSAREREILQLIAEGRSAKEIAFYLTISIPTVAFHRNNLKKKLGLRTTAELTRYAVQQGLVS